MPGGGWTPRIDISLIISIQRPTNIHIPSETFFSYVTTSIFHGFWPLEEAICLDTPAWVCPGTGHFLTFDRTSRYHLLPLLQQTKCVDRRTSGDRRRVRPKNLWRPETEAVLETGATQNSSYATQVHRRIAASYYLVA